MKYFKVFCILFTFIICFSCNKIDRKALVNRHNIVQTQADPLNPLSIGNGEFAFTADITGMQTFPELYEQGISLGTFSQWAWHTFPNPENFTLNDVVKKYAVGTDSIPYWYQFSALDNNKHFAATEWLRENPHRLHLGIIGLQIVKKNGETITINDIQKPIQKLNLWTGELSSVFEIEGEQVTVVSFCHQSHDLLSFKIESKLIETGQLSVLLRFPYPARSKFNSGYNFDHHELHSTNIISEEGNNAIIQRQIDNDTYFTKLSWSDNAELIPNKEHQIQLKPCSSKNNIELSCIFSKETKDVKLPSFEQTAANNKTEWANFWKSGAAVDLSGSTDQRANELERRIVLSQYLTKIQCSGSLPAQETGLTTNSWYGKFHLEMHWWHAVHFILWNRPKIIEKQFEYYFDIFEKAKATAQMQGYEGVRWPKMTDPSGTESPSSIGVFLIWQQPHLIYFYELMRQNEADSAFLKKFYPLIEATADFMASYARWDSLSQRYVLGPALIPAQERFEPEITINPVYELAYWHWGLKTAQNIRTTLGNEPNKKWQHVIDHLSRLPVADSLYLFTENAVDSYTNPRYLTDHPIVLGITGFLPASTYIDQKILENTVNTIDSVWNWQTCWGWDFPLATMNATLLNNPQKAIEYLLMDTPKNNYLLNGHNYQRDDLKLYLPGNGGLLAAVAMLCQQNDINNNFSELNNWNIKYEGFGKMLH